MHMSVRVRKILCMFVCELANAKFAKRTGSSTFPNVTSDDVDVLMQIDISGLVLYSIY